jgi:nucleolar GTP-binding protein
LEATKDWIARVKNAPNAKEAAATTEEGCTRLVELMQSLVAPSLKDLMELQKSLRSAPAVRLDTPAVVLVGAPNVGKSSIVRAISSATPEVNNYPFTTRGMTLGHVEVFWSDEEEIAKAVIPKTRHGNRKRLAPEVVTGKYAFSELCQIMDSPGLLSRPDEERNEMESLTMAAMQHLPTAVMYVMDLSGDAGDRCSSIKDQLELRRDIRKRFPRRPWIDVVSKFDLGVDQEILDELEVILDGTPYIKLSVQEGIGISELHREILRMLEEVRVVLDAISIVDERSAGP